MGNALNIEETIRGYIEGTYNEELVIARIKDALGRDMAQTTFQKQELEWLRNHFDKIPLIIKSKLGCRVYIAIDSMRGSYLRQLCRHLSITKNKPLWTSVVDWWLKRFFMIDLVRKKRVSGGWGQNIYYFTPKGYYPNLVSFLITLMREKQKL